MRGGGGGRIGGMRGGRAVGLPTAMRAGRAGGGARGRMQPFRGDRHRADRFRSRIPFASPWGWWWPVDGIGWWDIWPCLVQVQTVAVDGTSVVYRWFQCDDGAYVSASSPGQPDVFYVAGAPGYGAYEGTMNDRNAGLMGALGALPNRMPLLQRPPPPSLPSVPKAGGPACQWQSVYSPGSKAPANIVSAIRAGLSIDPQGKIMSFAQVNGIMYSFQAQVTQDDWLRVRDNWPLIYPLFASLLQTQPISACLVPNPTVHPAFGAAEAGGGGTTDPNLQITAQTLAGIDPCVSTASSAVAGFQQAWNQTGDTNYGTPALTVDGKYGPATAAALAQVIGGNSSAPCVYCSDGSVKHPGETCAAPAPPPAPTPPAPVPPPSPAPGGGGGTGLIIAAVAAALVTGGAVAYYRQKGGRKGRRR
jgi:hypothetical protein